MPSAFPVSVGLLSKEGSRKQTALLSFTWPPDVLACRSMSTNSDSEIRGESAVDWHAARQHLHRCLTRQLDRLDESQIEDLVQEAAVRLLRVVRREGARNLEALMNLIARRTAIDFIRCRRRWAIIWEPMTEVTTNRPDSSAKMPDILGDPQERVEFLVIEFFRARKGSCVELAMAFFRKRDWRSVSKEIGASHDAIRARWSRCVALLRREAARDPGLLFLADWARG
jgi:DNA-directed RNA polymerase specialized sigma24 family protein